ncbi:hypothetical protein ACFP2T_35835 [Plantactinospora solaniradicis]|uniref:Uncharacterized protein n=1 Tax=Plantactinospora solaniradicis TaxID=1723736 RepID=A0ABW1KIE1_9ACTN
MTDSWQRQMERDAFRICWPDDTLGPNDSVKIEMNWHDAVEGYRWSSWTWESGEDARATITVTWVRKWHDPRQDAPGSRVYWGVYDPSNQYREYSGQEAVDFFLRLMRGND